MMPAAFILDHLPFDELLEDVLLLLQHDEKELEKQTTYFEKMVQGGEKSEAYLERFAERLRHQQTRVEFVNQLLCRCQTYHFRCIAIALEEAEREAKKRGTPNKYGVCLFINEGVNPEILIL